MKKRPIPEYDKASPFNGLFKPVSNVQTSKDFYECMKEIFPDLWPERLQEWRETVEKESHEPEPLLFITLTCWAHFRTISPEEQLKDVQEYLYSWLAWGDGRMRADVAKLVVDAMSPEIRRAIEERGHQRGYPDNQYFRKSGRIPEYRGVWIAALAIADHLAQEGMEPAKAKDKAVKLISVLLEKEEDSALREFNRYQKEAPKNIISKLTKELVNEYRFWMIQDGVYEGDISPPPDNAHEYAAWKSKHKSFPYFFRTHGREGLSDIVLTRIKPNLWKPLWDMKVGRAKQKRKRIN